MAYSLSLITLLYTTITTTTNEDFTTTKRDDGVWVASLMNVGRLIGVCIRLKMEKTYLWIIGILMLSAWLFVIVARFFFAMPSLHYLASLSAGLSLGMAGNNFPLFVGEISSPKIPGTPMIINFFGTTIIRILLDDITKTSLSVFMFFYISLFPNICFVLLFLSLLKNTNVPLSSIITKVKERLRKFNRPENRRAMISTILLNFFVQYIGVNTVKHNMDIFSSAGIDATDNANLRIVYSLLEILTGWLAANYIADKYKHKMLIISSAVVCGIMMVFGTILALLENGFYPHTLQWPLIATTILLTVTFCIGIVKVPRMISKDLLIDKDIQHVTAGIISIFNGIYAFVAIKSYEPIKDTVGAPCFYWLQALLMLCCTIFSLQCIPKSTSEMQYEAEDSSNPETKTPGRTLNDASAASETEQIPLQTYSQFSV